MAIKNPDGTPYQLGCLNQYNPDAPEAALFDLWDQAAIEMGGSPLYYYEIFINTTDIDDIYLEARNKIYSEQPIEIYGFYDPVASQNALGTFGLDSPDELMFQFNRSYLLSKLGHLPRFGARIHSPHMKEEWVVIQRSPDQFHMWGKFRIQVMCQRFQESSTTMNGKVTAKKPLSPYKKDSIKNYGFAGGQPPVF